MAGHWRMPRHEALPAQVTTGYSLPGKECPDIATLTSRSRRKAGQVWRGPSSLPTIMATRRHGTSQLRRRRIRRLPSTCAVRMRGLSLVSHSPMARIIPTRARTQLAVRTLAQRASTRHIGVLPHASVCASLQGRLTLEPRRSSRTRRTASRIVTMFHPVSDTRTSASLRPSSPKSTQPRITIHAASGSRTMMAGMKKSPITDGRRPSVARLASQVTVSRR